MSRSPLKIVRYDLKWSGRCRARAAQTARNCHRQREKTTSGVLAPLTNVLGRTRPRLLSPPSSDSDVHSDFDEDLQPVGARIGPDYTPRPIYVLRASFRYKLTLADGTTRTEKEIDVEQLRASGLRPESLIRRCSYWNEPEGRAHASLVSSRLLPSSRGSFVVFVRW
jgi:hypothetical protein